VGSLVLVLLLVFVKVCGITTEADALLAVAMGADAVGFIFAPSKRQVAQNRAGDIAKRLPPDILTVGVFKDHAPKRVVEIVNRQGLGAAQLHGSESVEDTQYVAERVPRTMKVFTAGRERFAIADKWGTNPIMLDAAKEGPNTTYDYALARQAPAGLQVLLAGGLTPDNVAEAIKAAHPWGVDVASGVERAPGEKEPKLVADFIKNAKAAGAELLPRTSAPAIGAFQASVDCESPVSGPYDWASDSAL